MATTILRQPTRVMVHGGTTHYVTNGFCLQCNETEEYLTENGGALIGTIDSNGRAYSLDVIVHESPRSVPAKRPCYCDSVYHPQGC